ncbi:MAG: signal peptidase I [archaeon]
MNKTKKIKEFFKKFWYLLWKDDSFKGWIFSIVFLFVFIKFVFFPTLSLLTGTALPLAIVDSCSMYHKGNIFSDFDSWWTTHEEKYTPYNINHETFDKFKLENGFSKGDILFMIKATPEKLKVGDIIIFEAGQKNPIIHRIIKIEKKGEEYFFSTIGDNNNGQLSVEKKISQSQLVGKAVFRLVPYVGWGKLIFYEKARPLQERRFCKEN